MIQNYPVKRGKGGVPVYFMYKFSIFQENRYWLIPLNISGALEHVKFVS